MTVHLKPSTDELHELVDYIPRNSGYQTVSKRIFDVAFVLLAAPIIFPLIALFAGLVALDGGNPFFLQKRVGLDGRIFTMFKLRSMVPNAEAKLLSYLESNAEARAEWSEKQKLTRDPRITRIGRIIRKTSVDELPQFLNVLMGNMSVVGPRPMMPSQRELYPGQAYYALKPGVTGYWQIGDRHETSFADRAVYDAKYYTEMSLLTDISVVFKTVKVVCRGTGA